MSVATIEADLSKTAATSVERECKARAALPHVARCRNMSQTAFFAQPLLRQSEFATCRMSQMSQVSPQRAVRHQPTAARCSMTAAWIISALTSYRPMKSRRFAACSMENITAFVRPHAPRAHKQKRLPFHRGAFCIHAPIATAARATLTRARSAVSHPSTPPHAP